jgi:oxygen-independent coproporphyrinogen-3 oxidase
VAVYLHFPFCTNLCSYCDFYKERFHPEDARRLFQAIGYETEATLLSFGHEPVEVASIYIGGGTPSLADPAIVERWLGLLSVYCRFLPDYECTIEANPESLTDEFARRAFAAGVNRIVIGVQSFAVGSLKQLHRKQTTRDIYQAFYRVRMAGFENIAADLIFGLPGQTMKKMRIDIDRLSALEPNHISFYQLTVEPETRLAEDVRAGTVRLPDEAVMAAMYRLGSHLLIDKKYRRYEVSNFARDGFSSRHNDAYWNGSPYIGLGPAAHGFVNNHRYGNIAHVKTYIEAVEAGQAPVAFVEELTDEQRLMETVMLSLRTAAGIDRERLLLRFGAAAERILDGPVTARYIQSRYLLDEGGFIRLTDDGFLVADKIIADILA